jgi:hypothetical protein
LSSGKNSGLEVPEKGIPRQQGRKEGNGITTAKEMQIRIMNNSLGTCAGGGKDTMQKFLRNLATSTASQQ